MNDQQRKLIEWQRLLLSEAGSIGYRIVETEPLSPAFYADLVASLEALAARVKRENSSEGMSKTYASPDA